MRRDNSSPHGDMKGKIVISFISFIIGLQARNVLDLFSTTSSYEISSQSRGNYNNDAWAPRVSRLDWRRHTTTKSVVSRVEITTMTHLLLKSLSSIGEMPTRHRNRQHRDTQKETNWTPPTMHLQILRQTHQPWRQCQNDRRKFQDSTGGIIQKHLNLYYGRYLHGGISTCRLRDAPTMAPKPKRQKEIPRFNRDNYTQTSEPLLWSLPTRGLSNLPSADEFMKSYIAEKTRLGKDIPWEMPLGDEQAVKLPLPIIGLNFPKSATLTLKEFFSCGGLTAIHTSAQQGRIAICMRENLLAGNAPLNGCNHTQDEKTGEVKPNDFFSDIGTQAPCYYSSLHDGGLEAIAEHYPHATIMLVTRNAKSWHRSMSGWGSILAHWRIKCGFDGNLNHTKSDYWHKKWILSTGRKKENYWIDFYNAHTQKIRDFAMKNPSLTYVEVELEDENMAKKLEYYTGVPSTCVMDCHPGPKWIREHPNVTGKCLSI